MTSSFATATVDVRSITPRERLLRKPAGQPAGRVPAALAAPS